MKEDNLASFTQHFENLENLGNFRLNDYLVGNSTIFGFTGTFLKNFSPTSHRLESSGIPDRHWKYPEIPTTVRLFVSERKHVTKNQLLRTGIVTSFLLLILKGIADQLREFWSVFQSVLNEVQREP